MRAASCARAMRVLLAVPDQGLPAEVEHALRAAATAGGHTVLDSAPAAHAGLAASERARFLATVDRLMEADMLVADVSVPDAGVGWCVSWFLARGRLVVLSCRRDARAGVPSMLAGNPSPWQRFVLYDRPEELAGVLKATLG